MNRRLCRRHAVVAVGRRARLARGILCPAEIRPFRRELRLQTAIDRRGGQRKCNYLRAALAAEDGEDALVGNGPKLHRFSIVGHAHRAALSNRSVFGNGIVVHKSLRECKAAVQPFLKRLIGASLPQKYERASRFRLNANGRALLLVDRERDGRGLGLRREAIANLDLNDVVCLCSVQRYGNRTGSRNRLSANGHNVAVLPLTVGQIFRVDAALQIQTCRRRWHPERIFRHRRIIFLRAVALQLQLAAAAGRLQAVQGETPPQRDKIVRVIFHAVHRSGQAERQLISKRVSRQNSLSQRNAEVIAAVQRGRLQFAVSVQGHWCIPHAAVSGCKGSPSSDGIFIVRHGYRILMHRGREGRGHRVRLRISIYGACAECDRLKLRIRWNVDVAEAGRTFQLERSRCVVIGILCGHIGVGFPADQRIKIGFSTSCAVALAVIVEHFARRVGHTERHIAGRVEGSALSRSGPQRQRVAVFIAAARNGNSGCRCAVQRHRNALARGNRSVVHSDGIPSHGRRRADVYAGQGIQNLIRVAVLQRRKCALSRSLHDLLFSVGARGCHGECRECRQAIKAQCQRHALRAAAVRPVERKYHCISIRARPEHIGDRRDFAIFGKCLVIQLAGRPGVAHAQCGILRRVRAAVNKGIELPGKCIRDRRCHRVRIKPGVRIEAILKGRVVVVCRGERKRCLVEPAARG